MRIGWFNGVTVLAGACCLRFDPQSHRGSNAVSFVSHAHGDHVGGLSHEGRRYLTPQTLDIGKVVHNIDGEGLIPIKLGESIKLEMIQVRAHNAGHMLGSAQFELTGPSSTLVYTGDINCRDMFTTSAAESIRCDILVLETTYGVPFYTFPDLTQTSVEIVKWALSQIKVGKIPVFKTYSGGKAQEIVRIFNTLTKIPVITEGLTSGITEVYTRNGVDLRYVDSRSIEAKEIVKAGECVCVTSSTNGLSSLQNPSTAVATGWALGRRFGGVQAAFPLSGHADFRQLLEYVAQARPREVLAVHGFKAEFSSYVKKKLGIKARPIPAISQRLLGEYLQP